MEGVVKVEWHDQDYLHLKWHVVSSGLATPVLEHYDSHSYLSTSAFGAVLLHH